MSRSQIQRLSDILVACEAIETYLRRADADADMVFDAIRIRLVEIGEAVKGLDPELTALAPEIPWEESARMRDLLAHRYFDTAHSIVFTTARLDIPLLAAATRRIRDQVGDR